MITEADKLVDEWATSRALLFVLIGCLESKSYRLLVRERGVR